ncbi:MAG: hypothetical protein HFG28_09570 [Eubacterium sp.]|nr:hypothetical protein [Eubacterium sp.]
MKSNNSGKNNTTAGNKSKTCVFCDGTGEYNPDKDLINLIRGCMMIDSNKYIL